MVCAAIWLASAAAGTWATPKLAILILVIGGMFIFPLTQLALRAMGRPASLAPDNPLRWLAMQVAFMVPLCLPVVLGATAHRLRAGGKTSHPAAWARTKCFWAALLH